MRNKTERVLKLLQKLHKADPEKLATIDLYELEKYKSMEGIGHRTIRNALNEFCEKRNIKRAPTNTKTVKVERFLSTLSREDVSRLSGLMLLSVPELSGIGKTTLTTALSWYRKTHQITKRKIGIAKAIKTKKKKQNQSLFKSDVRIGVDLLLSNVGEHDRMKFISAAMSILADELTAE